MSQKVRTSRGPYRAGSLYPACLGETAESGDPALQPTATSRLGLAPGLRL